MLLATLLGAGGTACGEENSAGLIVAFVAGLAIGALLIGLAVWRTTSTAPYNWPSWQAMIAGLIGGVVAVVIAIFVGASALPDCTAAGEPGPMRSSWRQAVTA